MEAGRGESAKSVPTFLAASLVLVPVVATVAPLAWFARMGR